MNFSPESTPISRNAGIDFLRGLSIILVVIHHIGLRIPLKDGVLSKFLPNWFLIALTDKGYEAVFVFFVISGFLITLHTLQRHRSLGNIDIRNFYSRRAARILPCLVFLIAVLSLLHYLGISHYIISHSNQSLSRSIVAALGLHLNWYEGHTGYLPGNWDVLWSLSIEEVFYLGFPLLCLILRKNWLLVPSLLVLAFSLPISRAALAGNEIWQEKAYLPGMSAIATGVLSALLAFKWRPKHQWWYSLVFMAGSAGLLVIFFFEGKIWHLFGNGTMLLLTLSTACLLLAFYWKEKRGQTRTLRGIGWICSWGQLSYEIYLTHMFIVFSIVSLFKEFGSVLSWGFVWYLPALILSWILGKVTAKYISNPCEKTLRKQLNYITPSNTPTKIQIQQE